ncbi:discoidin domain-containing protein [Lysinibacillus sp. NPDC093692]|uniref:discoidin domain-containing protein n=1 Tax=Lysinibacillus sp. NPDC093692 TaxID=3390578 RepID=UPI003D00C39A
MGTTIVEDSNWGWGTRTGTLNYSVMYLYDKLFDFTNCTVKTIQLDLSSTVNKSMNMYFVSEDLKTVVKYHYVSSFTNNGTIDLDIDIENDPVFQNNKRLYIAFTLPNGVSSNAFVNNAQTQTRSITAWSSIYGYVYNKDGAVFSGNFTNPTTLGFRLKLVYENSLSNKILLHSNDETYSIESINTQFEFQMTSNTTPSPLSVGTSSQNSSYPAWKAFDGKSDTFWQMNNGTATGYIYTNFGEEIVANTLTLTAKDNAVDTMIKEFRISGTNDNTNFDTLKTIKNEINWVDGETRKYHFNNEKTYRYYRIDIESNNGNTVASAIAEIQYSYEKDNIIKLPFLTKKNFISYGQEEFNNSSVVYKNKNYVLQENNNSFLTSKLDRKPLSISFK